MKRKQSKLDKVLGIGEQIDLFGPEEESPRETEAYSDPGEPETRASRHRKRVTPRSTASTLPCGCTIYRRGSVSRLDREADCFRWHSEEWPGSNKQVAE